ncbi:metallophosphoesterase family protein [Blastopirellula sp. J2-11]|uniref:purple acid phosphatase family protein n=1 Tax=Blastopirellula sp. J2-11 TaxID=2943192 RepID=UPI0021C729EC|nr:metallophosphoesterase family protein [Blastopirellula sp. J2-11]UUO07073.1 metallophosphoesterase family protein [Blastopirellula sp. J2-11]
MSFVDRRRFLQSSLGGISAVALGGGLQADDSASPEGGAPIAPHDSLFLTWRQDPTTTMVIQWIGKSDDATQIAYAPLKDGMWRTAPVIAKPFPDTDRYVLRCELVGLTPGSEYKFLVGDAKQRYRFRTMPAKATKEFCFVSGGDAGTGRHAVNSNRVAANQDPYFVLIGGDLAYDNGASPKTFLKFLQNYSSTMVDSAGRLIPMVSCIGNHEVQGHFGARRDQAGSYLSVFDAFYQDVTYGTLDFGDYLSLVMLDTGHIADIQGEQTDWLEKTLTARAEIPHLFGVNHVPCYPSYRNPEGKDEKLGIGEEQRKLWCPLFEKHKVDVVLEHHDHTFKRTHPLTDGRIDANGVHYLGDGSWGQLRAPKRPEERPYLAKVSQAYHVTVHRLEGDRRFHVAMEDTGKIADVVTTVSKRASKRG